jgi:hypothetical protein
MKSVILGIMLWMASTMALASDFYVGILAQGRQIFGKADNQKFSINVPQLNALAGFKFFDCLAIKLIAQRKLT